jgi:hypothetical protein
MLVLESWILLAYFDFMMRFRGFGELHRVVKDRSVQAINSAVPSNTLCHAIDLACVFYFKRVLCLQRSAATTLLLRRHGWRAKMVIGAQVIPFRSHAWVEIQGTIVNDRPYMLEIYQVLERC